MVIIINYYKQLGIKLFATADEIKEAYCKKIKKYPPEKEVEDFKRIKNAYLILSDPETRQEYNFMLQLPEVVRKKYGKALKCLEELYIEDSISILDMIVKKYPQLEFVKTYLAIAYTLNGNYEKGVDILKWLTRKFPNNILYLIKLGEIYVLKRYTNKAIKVLNKALSIDRNEINIWLDILQAYFQADNFEKTLEVAEQVLSSKNFAWLKQNFYYYILICYIKLDNANPDYDYEVKFFEALKNLEDLVDQKSYIEEECSFIVVSILTLLLQLSAFKWSDRILVFANKLPTFQNSFLKIYFQKIEKYIKILAIRNTFEEDEEISEIFKDLISIELGCLDGDYDDESEEMKIMIELEIASRYKQYKTSINKIKHKYPELYELKIDFFDRISTDYKRNNFIKDSIKNNKELMKQMSNSILDSEDKNEDNQEKIEIINDFIYNSEEKQQPIVKGPKVGRNEPCTCGSGKKYKYCCGK